MSAKQKANQIYNLYWSAVSRGPIAAQDPIPDIRPLIEAALIEAESNGEKAGAEKEREACAQFLDKQAQGFQVLIDHAPTPIRAEDLKRVKHSIEVVAKQTRARSNG